LLLPLTRVLFSPLLKQSPMRMLFSIEAILSISSLALFLLAGLFMKISASQWPLYLLTWATQQMTPLFLL